MGTTVWTRPRLSAHSFKLSKTLDTYVSVKSEAYEGIRMAVEVGHLDLETLNLSTR